jgi:hypothetical protein
LLQCILQSKRFMRLFFSFSIFILASCSTKEKLCTPPPLPTYFRVVSPTGTDLLNPFTPGAYDTSSIKMYSSLSATEYKLHVGNPGSDSFLLETMVYQNWKNAPQLFLKFPDGDIDTITTTQKTETSNGCSVYELISLTYNGAVISPGIIYYGTNNTVKGYTIIK